MSPAGTAMLLFRRPRSQGWTIFNLAAIASSAADIPGHLKRRVAPRAMGSHRSPHGRRGSRQPAQTERRAGRLLLVQYRVVQRTVCRPNARPMLARLRRPWSPPTRWTRDVPVWTWAVGTVRFFPKRGESPPSLPGGWFALVKTWPPGVRDTTGQARPEPGRVGLVAIAARAAIRACLPPPEIVQIWTISLGPEHPSSGGAPVFQVPALGTTCSMRISGCPGVSGHPDTRIIDG